MRPAMYGSIPRYTCVFTHLMQIHVWMLDARISRDIRCTLRPREPFLLWDFSFRIIFNRLTTRYNTQLLYSCLDTFNWPQRDREKHNFRLSSNEFSFLNLVMPSSITFSVPPKPQKPFADLLRCFGYTHTRPLSLSLSLYTCYGVIR